MTASQRTINSFSTSSTRGQGGGSGWSGTVRAGSALGTVTVTVFETKQVVLLQVPHLYWFLLFMMMVSVHFTNPAPHSISKDSFDCPSLNTKPVRSMFVLKTFIFCDFLKRLMSFHYMHVMLCSCPAYLISEWPFFHSGIIEVTGFSFCTPDKRFIAQKLSLCITLWRSFPSLLTAPKQITCITPSVGHVDCFQSKN